MEGTPAPGPRPVHFHAFCRCLNFTIEGDIISFETTKEINDLYEYFADMRISEHIPSVRNIVPSTHVIGLEDTVTFVQVDKDTIVTTSTFPNLEMMKQVDPHSSNYCRMKICLNCGCPLVVITQEGDIFVPLNLFYFDKCDEGTFPNGARTKFCKSLKILYSPLSNISNGHTNPENRLRTKKFNQLHDIQEYKNYYEDAIIKGEMSEKDSGEERTENDGESMEDKSMDTLRRSLEEKVLKYRDYLEKNKHKKIENYKTKLKAKLNVNVDEVKKVMILVAQRCATETSTLTTATDSRNPSKSTLNSPVSTFTKGGDNNTNNFASTDGDNNTNVKPESHEVKEFNDSPVRSSGVTSEELETQMGSVANIPRGRPNDDPEDDAARMITQFESYVRGNRQ